MNAHGGFRALGLEFLPVDDQCHHLRVQKTRSCYPCRAFAVVVCGDDVVEVDSWHECAGEVDEPVVDLLREAICLGSNIVHVPKVHFLAAMYSSLNRAGQESDLI